MTFSLPGKRVWVAGHNGMVGSAVAQKLGVADAEVIAVSKAELDLRNQVAVDDFIAGTKPDAIVIAAAKVGGIQANDRSPADFLFDNLQIETNIFGAAHKHDVRRLLFLGSSCIYPKFADQPIREDALLTGPLEPTNEWYAIAKIAGIKMAQAFRRQYGRDYISAMPTNLYGPGDNFDLESSHVIPALIRKADDAKRNNAPSITLWGTGTPRREFLHVDDCADALVLLLEAYHDNEHINVGAGQDLPIVELAKLVCEVVGFEGAIVTDPAKPDGTPRKLMSADRIRALGWSPSIGLREGLAQTYAWYLDHMVPR